MFCCSEQSKPKIKMFNKNIIFEGFMQNGLYHRNQCNFLRMKSCIKIDFRHIFENKYVF